jgi:hypothetical protein
MTNQPNAFRAMLAVEIRIALLLRIEDGTDNALERLRFSETGILLGMILDSGRIAVGHFQESQLLSALQNSSFAKNDA